MMQYKRADDVVQKAADWLTKQLFLDAYLASDEVAWKHDGAAHQWSSLGDCIEFSEDFLAITNDGAPPIYLAMFRSAAGAKLRRVTVKIKVKKAGAIHEQRISFDHLDRRPVRKALDGIPLKPKRSRSTQGVKLGDVYLKLVSAVSEQGVDLVGGRKVATIFSPTCTVSLLHHYAAQWGQYWNIDEIIRARQAAKNRWYRRLVQSAGQLWRPLRLRRAAFYGLANPIALSIAFWSRNVFSARALRAQVADQQPGMTPSPGAAEPGGLAIAERQPAPAA